MSETEMIGPNNKLKSTFWHRSCLYTRIYIRRYHCTRSEINSFNLKESFLLCTAEISSFKDQMNLEANNFNKF